MLYAVSLLDIAHVSRNGAVTIPKLNPSFVGVEFEHSKADSFAVSMNNHRKTSNPRVILSVGHCAGTNSFPGVPTCSDHAFRARASKVNNCPKQTHESKTDPDAKLARTSPGKEAKFSYSGNLPRLGM